MLPKVLQETIDNRATSVDLSRYNDPELFKLLVEKCPQITEVSCQFLCLEDELIHLPNLTSLILHGSNTRNEIIYKLFSFTKLEHLTILNEEYLRIDFFRKLRELPNLRSIALIGCDCITDEVVECLSTFPSLTSVRLEGNFNSNMTDDALLSLSSRKQLLSLHIVSADISDDGVKHLRCLDQLRELTLVNTNITRYSLFIISQLKALEKLTICPDDDVITDVALKAVSKLTRLKELCLSPCMYVTQKGFDYLSSLSQLTKLEINKDVAYDVSEDRYFVPVHLKALESMPLLEYVKIKRGRFFQDGWLSSLSHLTCLKHLDLSSFYSLHKAGTEYLSSLSHLETLDLSWSNIEDQDLKFLPSLSQLRILKICSYKGSGEGFRYIGQLESLRELDLSYSRKLVDDTFKYLIPLKKLEVLDLSECESITDTSLKYIGELENIKELDIPRKRLPTEDSNCITDEGIKFLSKSKTLTRLNLYKRSRLTDKVFDYLAEMKELLSVNLVMCKWISEERAREFSAETKVVVFNTKWKKLKKRANP